ncbi:hypothetical protein H2203_006010 [Taxawa tesnikishii (nom. ined.)]|nr:hypothetical protein H2203_006010 [Dothideales sp. JES 119]
MKGSKINNKLNILSSAQGGRFRASVKAHINHITRAAVLNKLRHYAACAQLQHLLNHEHTGRRMVQVRQARSMQRLTQVYLFELNRYRGTYPNPIQPLKMAFMETTHAALEEGK